jgi:acylphosphatase
LATQPVSHHENYNCTCWSFVFYICLFSIVSIAGQALPPPAPIAHEQPLLYPGSLSVREYVVQIVMWNINGSLASLAQPGGFRKLVATQCSRIGLAGFVWRVPRSDGKILARGSGPKIDALLEFLKEMVDVSLVGGFAAEDHHDFSVLSNNFIVKPSSRRRVITGRYSDTALDDVASNNSADHTPVLGGLGSDA